MEVLIAESSQVLRKSLVRIVNTLPGRTRVFEVENYTQFKQEFARVSPRMVLLDLFLAGGEGFSMLDRIVEQYDRCQIVVLLDNYDESLAKRARKRGVRAVFSKSDNLFSSMLELSKSMQKVPSTKHYSKPATVENQID